MSLDGSIECTKSLFVEQLWSVYFIQTWELHESTLSNWAGPSSISCGRCEWWTSDGCCESHWNADKPLCASAQRLYRHPFRPVTWTNLLLFSQFHLDGNMDQVSFTYITRWNRLQIYSHMQSCLEIHHLSYIFEHVLTVVMCKLTASFHSSKH